ncbi:MAG: hypothetical protein Q9220_001822 [cf. Caloplaca sp. 1 TL-2023]
MSHQPSLSSSNIQEVFSDRPVVPPKPFIDSSRLAPGDAFFPQPPIRPYGEPKFHAGPIDGFVNSNSNSSYGRRRRDKDRGRSGSRRGKGEWKKLLWVKQPKCTIIIVLYAQHTIDKLLDPDNYTDPPTFLSHLQRNPRLQPYDFWPLVADSTVIVQHLASVTIFVCCFVAIYREQVSPITVVSLGTAGTILGWAFWDYWVGQVELTRSAFKNGTVSDFRAQSRSAHGVGEQAIDQNESRPPSQGSEPNGLGLTLTSSNLARANGDLPLDSLGRKLPAPSAPSPSSSTQLEDQDAVHSYGTESRHHRHEIILSSRNQQRLATAKSAVLIYCGLLGLSPILKSLTMSTSKDSIWAISAWLMCINILFFDYGGGVGVKFPASLSTNAALMSSTVLASRLPNTTHVFSLTLFSIEVFGLFPVFRRHLRHISWQNHLFLTLALVVGAGAGSGATLSESGGWQAALTGMLLYSLAVALGMGICSWRLIGLQRYKNVVIGPWDPARPVIRGGSWE